MNQLTPRQYRILQFIQTQESTSNAGIRAYFIQVSVPISRITLIRELDILVHTKSIQKYGAGRNVRYKLTEETPLLRVIDPEFYFKTESDQRTILKTFNFDIFTSFSAPIFTESEQQKLTALTLAYQKNQASMPPYLIQKETQRLTIELSWKSSQIEGNTYSLLDTEALVKENREAPGHTKEEALMILNHKYAIDYIMAHPENFTIMSLRKIEDIHGLLVQNLPGVHHGIRHHQVRIIGTNYYPLDTPYQVKEALESTVDLVNRQKNPFQKALSAILLISYIQPFIDGNKRAARLIGNALLHAHRACPLSYRSIDPVDYKKAVLLFYEQNSLAYFKTLFIAQYEFSVKNYFSDLK